MIQILFNEFGRLLCTAGYFMGSIVPPKHVQHHVAYVSTIYHHEIWMFMLTCSLHELPLYVMYIVFIACYLV